jgi:hypothetical protein
VHLEHHVTRVSERRGAGTDGGPPFALSYREAGVERERRYDHVVLAAPCPPESDGGDDIA